MQVLVTVGSIFSLRCSCGKLERLRYQGRIQDFAQGRAPSNELVLKCYWMVYLQWCISVPVVGARPDAHPLDPCLGIVSFAIRNNICGPPPSCLPPHPPIVSPSPLPSLTPPPPTATIPRPAPSPSNLRPPCSSPASWTCCRRRRRACAPRRRPSPASRPKSVSSSRWVCED